MNGIEELARRQREGTRCCRRNEQRAEKGTERYVVSSSIMYYIDVVCTFTTIFFNNIFLKMYTRKLKC